MRAFAVVICVIVLPLFLNACGDSGTGSPLVGQIIPFNAGNSWIIDTTFFAANGDPIKGGYDSLFIDNKTILSKAGDTYYHYDGMYLTRRDGGLYSTNIANFFGPYLYLKFPGNAGDGFRDGIYTLNKPMATPTIQKPDSVTVIWTIYTIGSTNVSVTVPAGTFDCYAYNTDWWDGPHTKKYQEDILFFSPGVGQVKTEHYEIEGNQFVLKYKTELRRANLY